MVQIPIVGQTDVMLLFNYVFDRVPVAIGQQRMIGEATLTAVSMTPCPMEYRDSNPSEKYHGTFTLMLECPRREDFDAIAEFLSWDVCASSGETHVLQIGNVEVGDETKTRYVELLDDAFEQAQP